MPLQSISELCEEAGKRGSAWAHSCAATSLSPEGKEFLKNDADTLTAHLNATVFDAKANQEDALAQRRVEQLGLDKDDAEMALAKAQVEVRKCTQERAELVVPERPQASTVVTVCGTVLFAAGCAVGLYDWIHERITDPVLAGMTALAFGLALGAFGDEHLQRQFAQTTGMGTGRRTGPQPERRLLAVCFLRRRLAHGRSVDALRAGTCRHP
jgi:hypothetical protein